MSQGRFFAARYASIWTDNETGEQLHQIEDPDPRDDDNWVDRFAPRRLQPWLKLGRFDRPAGAWLLLHRSCRYSDSLNLRAVKTFFNAASKDLHKTENAI